MDTRLTASSFLDKLFAAAHQRGILTPIVPVITFLIYFRTLAPTVLPGDSGEFQFAAWGWTLSHPTGYPLYLLLGGIWQHLVPVGDPAYRLNLLSAVLSAATTVLSYRIFVRIAGHRGAALVATLAFAVSPTFWRQATESEVYALNTLLIVLLAWLAVKWQANRDFKYSAAWALIFGLALTHHRSIALLIPAFAAFFAESMYDRAYGYRTLLAGSRSHWLRRDAAYAALAAAPLLLYLYVPLRASATPYVTLQVSPASSIVTFDNSPAGWISYIAGQSFENELSLNQESVEALGALPQRLVSEFNPLGAVLGFAGLLAVLLRRKWGLAAFTIFGFMGIIVFNISYHIGDIADFYTPAFFLFTIWIAASLGEILQFVSHHTDLKAGLLPTIVLLLGVAALPVENFSSDFADQDKSLYSQSRTRWESILSPDLPSKAILISDNRDEITPMWYLQLVEGLRPDALGLFPKVSTGAAYANVMRLLGSVNGSGRPVFLIKSIPAVTIEYEVQSAPDGLVRVLDTPLPAPTRVTRTRLGDELEVLGYSVYPADVHPDTEITVAVYWHPLKALTRNYTTSLQVFDEAGVKLAQGVDHSPGGDTYPTSLWAPGETLRDSFSLTVPASTNPGSYHLFVKVYDPQTDDTLGDLTEIGTLGVGQ